MKRRQVKIGKRKGLVENLLIIDGISRAGKFLLADVVSGFESVEPVQCYSLLDHIPFLEKFGLIESKTAQELLRCEIDERCYEVRIGRNINHRKSDKSFILNHPRHEEILSRADEEDGEPALEKYYKENPYSLFMVHEVAPNLKIFFDTFPHVKILSVSRSPVHLVYSWYKRGFGTRYGADPRFFSVPLQSKNGLAPWFAFGWLDEYDTLSEMDRVIKAILTLTSMYRSAFKSFPEENRKKILPIRFEDLVTKTPVVLRRLGMFLKKKPLKEMQYVLQRENLPNKHYLNSTEMKWDEIKKFARRPFVASLEREEKAYWARGGI